MSEIETTQEAPEVALAPVQPQHPAVNAYSVSELVRIAQLIAKAVTLPKPLQDKPEDILAVMLAGRELGIGPMQSTRQIEIIQGQTALRSELKLALARRAHHDIRPVRRGPGYVAVQCVTCESHEVEWAYDRDVAARNEAGPSVVIASEVPGLVDKTNWRTWGFAMLWARAVGQLCREHCPEAVGGMYSAEELGGTADG